MSVATAESVPMAKEDLLYFIELTATVLVPSCKEAATPEKIKNNNR